MNFSLKLFSAALIVLSMAACSKSDDDSASNISTENVALAEECLTTEAIDNEITASINTALLVSESSYSTSSTTIEETAMTTKSASTLPDCMTISIKPLIGGFPKTITLDFGDGCVGDDGFTRSGSIAVTITDTLRAPGVSYSVVFDDFAIEGYSVAGTLYVENTGTETVPSFYEDMELVFTGTSGLTITKSKTIEREWSEGASTDDLTDDVFTITGSADSQSSSGYFYSYDITTPLVMSYDCDPISEGVMVLTISGQTDPITVDFGDGTCDWKATLSQAGRRSIEVDLSN
ncbi:hypothetical protein [Mangrovibacterium diazotrophicum]|uniref:Lipoprotein n=1 Tax=Mangrovibacterium diazotrophicum TaxID=1261403 RepID=A0A419W998_9BACT|nr:hypothetical protein [Mangrovibacterium diazotrophicum]RKD92047.1 hypothetical protein BC643_2417 [Mangrovibacterium diazotrophicum]